MSGEVSGIRVVRSGSCLVLTIDRPHRRNALSMAAAQALRSAMLEAGEDPAVRAVVLTGGGKVFVSGGDLYEFARLPPDRSGARKVIEMGQVAEAIEQCAVPVIAAVQGAALGGGCELVVACDIVVAARSATFTFRQAAMGLSTGWGGGTRLLERVGPLVAATLLLTGATMPAEDALAKGLVSEVVPDDQCLPRALALGEQIATLPRESVAALKQMVHSLRAGRRGESFALEERVFERLWGGGAHQRAMAAFLKGRNGFSHDEDLT